MRLGVLLLCLLALVAGSCSAGDSVGDGVVTSPEADARQPTAAVVVPATTAPLGTLVVPTPTALTVQEHSEPTPAPVLPTAVSAEAVDSPTPQAEDAVRPSTPTEVPEVAQPAPTPASVATAPPTGEPSTTRAALIANGGEVYTVNCARCHAESGLGTAQYSGLVGSIGAYNQQSMVAELTTGHPVTFGFAQKLSAEEIASVVAYVLATF